MALLLHVNREDLNCILPNSAVNKAYGQFCIIHPINNPRSICYQVTLSPKDNSLILDTKKPYAHLHERVLRNSCGYNDSALNVTRLRIKSNK